MKKFNRNNPMNIRYSEANRWEGQTGQSNGFCQFESEDYGFRAAFITLKNYGKQGFNTISKIINRWAPPSENPTSSYINFVARKMYHLGYCDDSLDMRDIRLDMKNDMVIVDLMMFMTQFESGIVIQTQTIIKRLQNVGMLVCDDEPTGERGIY